MASHENLEKALGTPCFRPVTSKVNFPELEERILNFWKERDLFHQVDQVRQDAPLFTLYEGPPTANGTPGIHHVLARVFKDVIPRYKTMQGFRPVRKGGWDTHGLPVELEIEKELGISTKHQIEEYGIERFNALCRESVMRYVKDWEELTDRIGFWIDMPNAYITFTNDYIETGWWIIKQLWDRGLMYLGTKGAPHCPRCVTTLSSHEVALGYQEDTPDPSVYVKFSLAQQWPEDRPRSAIYDRLMGDGIPVNLLAWTTTPWTLPGNTALAVAPEADYAVVEVTTDGGGQERLVLASALVERVIREEHRTVTTVKGAELEGLMYELLYDPQQYDTEVRRFTQSAINQGDVPSIEADHQVGQRVFAADFVSLEDGTGIVHIAPAFGDEDLNAGRQHGLAYVQPVDLQGRMTGNYPFAGKFVKDADEDIMRDLQERGLLYRREVYHHTYPFCWRCDSPLLYYAKSSWYLRTTAVQERLLSGNREINWYPEHIKEGRFGEWLRNNVDWALSRERYWGTPIPVWQCEGCGAYDCFGSVADLRERTLPEHRGALEPAGLDLHRPYVDQVIVGCQQCGGTMRRIPEVTDAWFDSGAMPFAQAHVMSGEGLEDLRRRSLFPADYICEAVDQTRGWFYTLHALSTFIAGEPCYRNVICLGLILDAKGEKMSKSRGNVVEPWAVINTHGADALRWYLFTAAPPGNARRFSADLVGESVRRFLLTLWNVYSFFVTYANIDGFNPKTAPVTEAASDLDRWVRSEVEQLVAEVTRLLDEYNPTDAGRRMEEFVDVLSNWYVRRSRRRFWKPVTSAGSVQGLRRLEGSENDQDKLSAYTTLYTCLTTITKLLAPLTPFVAEELYSNLVRSVDADAPESVHLADFPRADEKLIDRELSEAMRLAMHVASLGRAARSKAGIRVRQPLALLRVMTRNTIEEQALERLSDQLHDELNVKKVWATSEGNFDEVNFWDWRVEADMSKIGPKYGPRSRQIVEGLSQLRPQDVAASIKLGSSVDLPREDRTKAPVEILPEEILPTKLEPSGFSVVEEGGYVVAISTQITPSLADEGLARELVHRIQNMRRSAGFDIADRIVTWYRGDERIARVMQQHGDYIRQETLSVELHPGEPEPDAYTEEQTVDGAAVSLAVRQTT